MIQRSLASGRTGFSRRGFLAGAAVFAVAHRTTAALAQTPGAPPSFAPFRERIGELLGLIPASDDSDRSVMFTYADLEQQLASVGVSQPPVDGASEDDLPEGWLPVTEALPLPSNAFVSGREPAWTETFGFFPYAIDRTLVVGQPPGQIMIFAGGIDTERIRQALIASDYKTVNQETDGSYLTLGDGFDLNTQVGRLALDSMNHAVLGDDLVIFAGQESDIQQVSQVMAGLAPSMVEQSSLPDFMTTFADDVVGLLTMPPTLIATAKEGGASSVRQFAIGVRAGADNRDLQDAVENDREPPEPASIADLPAGRARVQVRIRYADEATARSEAEAIPNRWNEMTTAQHGQPFTDVMLVEDARVAADDPTVAAVDFRVKGPAGRWLQIVYNRDLAPFVPGQ